MVPLAIETIGVKLKLFFGRPVLLASIREDQELHKTIHNIIFLAAPFARKYFD